MEKTTTAQAVKEKSVNKNASVIPAKREARPVSLRPHHFDTETGKYRCIPAKGRPTHIDNEIKNIERLLKMKYDSFLRKHLEALRTLQKYHRIAVSKKNAHHG